MKKRKTRRKLLNRLRFLHAQPLHQLGFLNLARLLPLCDLVILRLSKCLQAHGFQVIDIVSAKVVTYVQVVLGPMGLRSANPLEQEAAISSLSNLMSIIPGDTYTEFEKHLLNLPERSGTLL